MSVDDVVTRLTETLEAAAEQCPVVPPPFDPTRRPSVVLPAEAGAPPSC